MNASDTRLLLALSKAQNLQELADLGCTLLGNPVFIDDMNRNILAYSGNVSIDDPLWQKNIVENLHDESLKSRRDSKEFYRKSLDTAHPVLLTDLETVPRYAMTLTNFGVPIGNATVASHLKAFEEGDEELFELFCSYARNLLTGSRFSTRKNQHLATNTLIRLLDGQPMTRSAVESKLESFFKGKSDRHIFLLAISDETGDALSCPSKPIIEDLSAIPNSIAFAYQSYILYIINPDPEQVSATNRLILDVLGKYDLYAGVSSSIRDIMHLPFYYDQAINAIKMSSFVGHERIYHYSDVAIYDMLGVLSDKFDLLDFCDEKLMKLFEYDQSHEKNLLKTLQVYLQTCLQYDITAKELFVHKNTVRYRISKCRNILQTDFTNGDKIFQYTLSLKILEFYHYF